MDKNYSLEREANLKAPHDTLANEPKFNSQGKISTDSKFSHPWTTSKHAGATNASNLYAANASGSSMQTSPQLQMNAPKPLINLSARKTDLTTGGLDARGSGSKRPYDQRGSMSGLEPELSEHVDKMVDLQRFPEAVGDGLRGSEHQELTDDKPKGKTSQSEKTVRDARSFDSLGCEEENLSIDEADELPVDSQSEAQVSRLASSRHAKVQRKKALRFNP